jgi:hypothetical protein
MNSAVQISSMVNVPPEIRESDFATPVSVKEVFYRDSDTL